MIWIIPRPIYYFAETNNGVILSQNRQKIDQLVYELYGLTEEEIKIVEESV